MLCLSCSEVGDDAFQCDPLDFSCLGLTQLHASAVYVFCQLWQTGNSTIIPFIKMFYCNKTHTTHFQNFCTIPNETVLTKQHLLLPVPPALVPLLLSMSMFLTQDITEGESFSTCPFMCGLLHLACVCPCCSMYPCIRISFLFKAE